MKTYYRTHADYFAAIKTLPACLLVCLFFFAINRSGACSINASYTVSVSGNTVTFNNNSRGANKYLWDFGDGQTSTEAHPVHVYNSSKVYAVILHATDTTVGECRDTAVFEALLSIDKKNREEEKLTMFPNPVMDVLTITSETYSINEIRITDLNSKVVVVHEFNEQEVRMDLSAVVSGIYVVTVKNNNNGIIKILRLIKI